MPDRWRRNTHRLYHCPNCPLPFSITGAPCLFCLAETCGVSVRVNRGLPAAIRFMPLPPSLAQGRRCVPVDVSGIYELFF
jgi:hypothetical protein